MFRALGINVNLYRSPHHPLRWMVASLNTESFAKDWRALCFSEECLQDFVLLKQPLSQNEFFDAYHLYNGSSIARCQ